MTGPLLVVPGVALWKVWEAVRKNKSFKEVLSTDQWRNRVAEEESKQPRHTPKEDANLYAYIDPLSRGACAKSTTNNRMSSIARRSVTRQLEEDKYSKLRERLSRWDEGTTTVGSNLTDRPDIGIGSNSDNDDDDGGGGGGGTATTMMTMAQQRKTARRMRRSGQQRASVPSSGGGAAAGLPTAASVLFGPLGGGGTVGTSSSCERAQHNMRRQQQQLARPESATDATAIRSPSKVDSSSAFLFGPPPVPFNAAPPVGTRLGGNRLPMGIEMTHLCSSPPKADSEPPPLKGQTAAEEAETD